MTLFFYNLLLMLLFPVLIVVYVYRLGRGKESATHYPERWGILPDAISADTRKLRFWVHAVSVGEVIAATPVLRELRARYPDALILLSVTTVGGREVAQSKIPPADYVIYFPLDFPLVVGKVVATVRPTALILMEWEIWPNLLNVVKQSGGTVAVINGRISDTGLKRGQAAKRFLGPALQSVDIFAMQSEEDARRAIQVGARPECVKSVGNTKFDEATTLLSPTERITLRTEFGIPEGVPVWICGSTRDAPDSTQSDEESLIVAAYTLLLKQIPNLQLIVAPRHLERTEAVEKILKQTGVPVRRRSQSTQESRDGLPPQILLLDTFGELANAYAIADVAFVGGSLVKRGGQSVFQPLAQGVPAVFGPFMNNQRDISALAQAEGVGFLVQNHDDLVRILSRLLTLPQHEKNLLSGKCRSLIERNQGVTARALDLLADAMARNGTKTS